MATNNVDDMSILNITTTDDGNVGLIDENLQNTSLNNSNPSTDDHETILIPLMSHFRPTNILRTFVFIEFLSILIIWFIGSRTHTLLDDIIHFDLTTSIFDLVIISTLKLIFLIILLTEFETLVVIRLYQPIVHRSFIHNQTLFIIALILIAIGSLSFAIIKMIIVLHRYSLSKLYLSALCIFLGLSSLELFGILLTYFYLKQLKLIEQQRSLNSRNKTFNLRRIFSLVQSERSWLLTGSFFLIIASLLDVIDLYLYGKIIGMAIGQESFRSVTITIAIVLGIDVVSSIAVFLHSWMFALVGQKMVQRLRQKLFNAIVKQDINFFDENRTGELTNRLSSDTQVVQDGVTGNMASFVQYLIHILGSLIVMFYLNVTLTLVLLIIVPIVVLIAMKYGNIVENLRKKFQDQLAQASSIADESISNIRTVRIFGSEDKIKKSYTDSLFQSFVVGKRLAFNDGLFTGVLGLLTAASISAVVWYGAKLIHDKKISTDALTSFLLYMLQVAIAFAVLASLYSEFMQAVGASERLFDLLDRQPKIPSTANASCSIKPIDFDGSIHFDHVYFTYPTRSEHTVLTDISFSIRSGQKIALVGPSGGGKSTIALLIERFYDPQSGTIYFGADPLPSIDPQWLRQNVSFVNQEPSLFACSIRDNIAFGFDPTTISFDDIIRVAKQANAHEFIERFENKYDTLVGEHGVLLSGGQRQRLAIARALLMNPKLLLLDEATSALDAESEHLIDEAIERAMINRSVLVIAHRLSTVRNADLVIVIDQGKIVEKGTHNSLMDKDDGIYKNLVLRQLTPAIST